LWDFIFKILYDVPVVYNVTAILSSGDRPAASAADVTEVGDCSAFMQGFEVITIIVLPSQLWPHLLGKLIRLASTSSVRTRATLNFMAFNL
jgi:hypothetical protein